MNFNEYVAKSNAAAFKPARKTTISKSTQKVEDFVPHKPGSISEGLTSQTADANNERAKAELTGGEVIGLDSATGEALIRQAGNRVVRASVPGASNGNPVKISGGSGVKTKSSVVSSTGWQPVEGRPGASRLTVVTVRDVEGLASLSDPCTPPDVKLQIVQREQAAGINIANGQVVGFGGVTGSTASQTDAYIRQLQDEIKAARNTPDQLPTSISGQGGTTAGQSFSTTLASLWGCVDNVCVQSPSGIFATKAQCEQNCGPRTYSCIAGQCIEVRGSTGQFQTLGDCINSNCGTRYTCIDGTPVPKRDGEFATIEAAISGGCYWGYDCVSGDCLPAIGGQFKSLSCCQQGCTDILSQWPVSITSATFDPPTQADQFRLQLVALQDPGKNPPQNTRFYGDGINARYSACNSIPIPENTTSIKVEFANFVTFSNVEFSRFEVFATGVGFEEVMLDFYVSQNNLLEEFSDFTNIIWAQQIIGDFESTPLYAPLISDFTNAFTSFNGIIVDSEPDVAGVSSVTRSRSLSGVYDPAYHQNPNGGTWGNCS